jgi:ABC-type transport system involved in cytochrome bd biosynthesis fused ATPase/permease subunit
MISPAPYVVGMATMVSASVLADSLTDPSLSTLVQNLGSFAVAAIVAWIFLKREAKSAAEAKESTEASRQELRDMLAAVQEDLRLEREAHGRTTATYLAHLAGHIDRKAGE